MTLNEVMGTLESYGNEGTKKVLMKHGAKEPFFGVKVQDLKKILKKTKKNHELALQLYATGNSDAMYLAGLMADEKQMTKAQLNEWVKQAYWYYLSEYAVAWVAAESDFGFELGMEWKDSPVEHIAAAGWATLLHYASIQPDNNLNIDTYNALLEYIPDHIHTAENRVRYAMNNFVIGVGSFIAPLTGKAKSIAEKIGKVKVYMGNTACKVPLATEYIDKVAAKGRIGKKKKHARC